MKHILNTFLFVFYFSGTGLYAQQEPAVAPRILKVASSKLGNYIYLAGEQEIAGKDSTVMQATDHFIIKRMPFELVTDSTRLKSVLKRMKTVGIAKKATTEKELNALFSVSDLADIRQFLSKKSNEEVLDFVSRYVKASDYGFLYTVTATRMMLGHVYLDTDVKEGQVVYYQVIRVDKNKAEHPWGVAVAQSKVGNYSLQHLKPKLSLVQPTDSMVNIIWKLKVSDATINEIPKPAARAAVDPDGNLLAIPFLPSSLAARVITTQDGKPGPETRLIGSLNAERDTLTFVYTAATKKDEQFTAYIMAEDEIYNQGIPSDTALTFGIEAKSLPLILGLDVTEIENGIQLAWEQLPARPYLTGVQIWRYDNQDKLDKLAILPASDTLYTDYAIQAGQTYRYEVKALFLPAIGITQEVPAQGTGTYTKFSKPLPAYELTAVPSGTNVSLTWKVNADPAFYGFYVYRGTSAKKMDLIAGPIKEAQYLDTAQSLSGRSQYYYAIIHQNLRQDTSDYSNIAMVRPAKSLGIDPPRDIQFYYINGILRVEWNDVRTIDNAIETFVVQRKKKSEATYLTLKVPGDKAFYQDSLIEKGVTYQYRVASVASNGEVSAYSAASEFGLEKDKVAGIDLFNLRSTSTGIELSLPMVVYSNRKGYNIYRRNVSGGDFSKVGWLGADTFIFMDAKTEVGQTYIYAISVTESDDREGAMGASLSVKR